MGSNEAVGGKSPLNEDAELHFRESYHALALRTDRLFGGLMIFQWLGSITLALTVSPRTWTGEMSAMHIHVWTAILLGGLISSLPLLLIWLQPGKPQTRHVIAIAQMLYSAMLIHLTGGRIETHFHVFGSLAFLAFYRDWRVLITASAVVAADHLLRGMFWPESVFGVITAGQYRWVEHAAWVVFEDVFLISQTLRGIDEMKAVSRRHCELQATNTLIEAKVQQRTRQLAEHRARLEETVQERTSALEVTLDDLRQTNAELEEANRHRNRFLSTMSHELRTPLNAIIGFAGLLDGQGFGALNAKQKQYVGHIGTSGNHLLSLINDILDVSRIDIGAMALKKEALEVRDILESVESMVSIHLSKKEARLVLDVASDVEAVEADERKAKQIIINLVTNAIKYSPQGGEVRIEARRISDTTVRFAVVDQGIGIAEDECALVFDEFHQVNRERDEAIGGIGLGLALCKRLVHLHGGEIGVKSKVGEGSEFWFTLPAVERAVPESDGRIESSSDLSSGDELGPSTILVVEDNEMNLVLLTEALSLLEVNVIVGRNGQECIDLAEKHHPDLILTDIRMPVLDGLEATRQLRQKPEFLVTPIIALTANASKVSLEECMEAGCTEYLSKPVDPQRLNKVLKKHLLGLELRDRTEALSGFAGNDTHE